MTGLDCRSTSPATNTLPSETHSDTVSDTSLSIEIHEHLPHIITFDKSGLGNWSAAAGGMALVLDDDPGEASVASEISETSPVHMSEYLMPHDSLTTEGNAPYRNVLIWNTDIGTVHRRFKLATKLLANTSGALHNGGLVLNYRQSSTVPGAYVWFVVQLDYDSQQFNIQRYNGSTLNATSAFANLSDITVGTWYTIDVYTVSIGANITIQASLYLETTRLAEITLTTNQYLPDFGKIGFHANRAESRFSYLLIEDKK